MYVVTYKHPISTRTATYANIRYEPGGYGYNATNPYSRYNVLYFGTYAAPHLVGGVAFKHDYPGTSVAIFNFDGTASGYRFESITFHLAVDGHLYVISYREGSTKTTALSTNDTILKTWNYLTFDIESQQGTTTIIGYVYTTVGTSTYTKTVFVTSGPTSVKAWINEEEAVNATLTHYHTYTSTATDPSMAIPRTFYEATCDPRSYLCFNDFHLLDTNEHCSYILYPISQQTASWTPTPSTSANWDCVDDVAPNTSNYITSTFLIDSGAFDVYQYSPIPVPSILLPSTEGTFIVRPYLHANYINLDGTSTATWKVVIHTPLITGTDTSTLTHTYIFIDSLGYTQGSSTTRFLPTEFSFNTQTFTRYQLDSVTGGPLQDQ